MNAGQLLQQANQLKRLGQLDEAIALYYQAIEINSQFSWTYYELGDALAKQGKLEEANIEFNKALKLNNILGGLIKRHSNFDLLHESVADYNHIISQIFPENPYNGFDFQQYTEDLQSWNGRHEVFAQVIHEIKPKIIIEVGVWKGQSTIHMAEIAKEVDPTVVAISIDTFLGSPEHWEVNSPENYQASLQLKHGYPRLYYQFIANVMWKGLENIVVPLPQTSVNAAIMLKKLGIKGNILHIDAGHDFENVYSDLVNYWDLVAEGGVLIGDDFMPSWPEVEKAVRHFCSERNLEFSVNVPKYLIYK